MREKKSCSLAKSFFGCRQRRKKKKKISFCQQKKNFFFCCPFRKLFCVELSISETFLCGAVRFGNFHVEIGHFSNIYVELEVFPKKKKEKKTKITKTQVKKLNKKVRTLFGQIIHSKKEQCPSRQKPSYPLLYTEVRQVL